MSSFGKLFLIPAPISSSANWVFDSVIETAIKSSRAIVCERIRTTRRMIKYLFDQEAFDQLHFIEIDKHGSTSYIDDAISDLKKGNHTALLSEAGLPCIADPGHLLVQAAHQNGIRIQPFPGPSSFMMALMASGLNGQRFTFHGYLPRDVEGLSSALRSIEKIVLKDGGSQIFMETPYRNQKLFETVLQKVNPALFLNVSMDISGANEWIKTASIAKWKKLSTTFDQKYPAVFIIGQP